MTSVRDRLRTVAAPAPLDAEGERAFARHLVDVHVFRLRVFLPVMALVHVAHVATHWLSPAERAASDPTTALWHDGVVAAHVAALAFNLVLLALLLRAPRASFAWLYGPAAAVIYLLHGAACASVDQLVVNNPGAFTGYCVGVAVVLVLAPRQALVTYALGAGAFVAGLLAMQPSGELRQNELGNAGSTMVVSLALGWVLHSARRRDFSQRRTIDAQKAELASLNTALEKRVQEQVAEIVKRADEVDALNIQLQARVRDRSNELSLALAKLALQREGDGTLKRGAVLGDRFEIDGPLGEGGMGAVYRGVDKSTGAPVAIKVIQAASAKQLDALHRFILEARTAATITHPAVVRVLHVDISDDGLLFQVQELVEGETLESWLRRKDAAAGGLAARIGSVLCEALAAAHAMGVVHRDVKPSNIMLTKTAPFVKLLDFGIAKLDDTDARFGAASAANGSARRNGGADVSGNARTGTGFFLGTPAYMAPEQKDGAREVTPKADVYAAGVVLFRMLTRKLPNERGTARARPHAPADTTKPDGHGLDFVADMKLASLVGDCLSDDPDGRPTAAALAASLARFADDAKATLDAVDVGGAAPAIDGQSDAQQETTWQRRT